MAPLWTRNLPVHSTYFIKKSIYLFIHLFRLHWVLVEACGLLSCGMHAGSSSPPAIEPGPPALGAWSLTHWTTREVPLATYFLKVSYSWIYLGLQPLHHSLRAILYFRTEFFQSVCKQNTNPHWSSSFMGEAKSWAARSACVGTGERTLSSGPVETVLLLPHPEAWFLPLPAVFSAQQLLMCWDRRAFTYHWGNEEKYSMKIPTEKVLTRGQNSPLVVAIKKEVDEIFGGRDREHTLRRALCFLSINGS